MSQVQQLRGKSRLSFVIASSLACFASTAIAITPEEANLIDEGFRLFTEETFDGNGRVCATCHIPERHYTIGPRDIRRLSRADRDLVFARNVPDLENDTLVSRLGLFNIGPGVGSGSAPVEGEATFRGSMAVAGLDVTTFDNFPQGPAAPSPTPVTRLGWSGDGSPNGSVHGIPVPNGDGSVLAFANGAILQHNPKSLNRVPGVDFRFATPDELEAMEAFQLWLGRRAAPAANPTIGPARFEFELDDLTFIDPRIEEGKAIFTSNEAACGTCHTNGGAHFNIALIAPPTGFPPFIVGANILQETGVEEDRERLSQQVGIQIPEDEGAPAPAGAFNLQSIIEAPRKHAFFHNSAVVGGVEDAAQFYFRPPFARTNGQPGTGAPNREALEAVAPGAFLDTAAAFRAEFGFDGFNKLGAFMRALSAYYMIVDCERLVEEAIERIDIGVSPELAADHCVFNLNDVSGFAGVLGGARLSPRPYSPLIGTSLQVARDITIAAEQNDSLGLQLTLDVLADLRRFIATTPQLP